MHAGRPNMTRLWTSLATLVVVGSWVVDSQAQSETPAQKSGWQRPRSTHVTRVSVFLAEGRFADREGIGISGEYDIPVIAEAGPGRLFAGPAARFLWALSQNEHLRGTWQGRPIPAGCDVRHHDRIIAGSLRFRYVLDVHTRLRPWAIAGIGVDYARHKVSLPGRALRVRCRRG